MNEISISASAFKLPPLPACESQSAALESQRMFRSPRPLRAFDVQAYRVCEGLTGFLICLMVVFSPWAFGTTQRWAIWTMNGVGYVLGLLLLVKLAIRHFKGYRPPRWPEAQASLQPGDANSPSPLPSPKGEGKPPDASADLQSLKRPSSAVPHRCKITSKNLTLVLAVLTAGILGFCLISAVNARGTYEPQALSFVYHDCLNWLPHSLDSNRTWLAFWNYLALACSFWSARDWLLGKSTGEQRAQRRTLSELTPSLSQTGPPFPARLRLLLWLLAINGGLLAIEGIAQRLEGSGKLLFLVKPRVNPGAESQFGTYAYRSNAAQYFNLLWPVCFGFWWMLHRSCGFKRKSHHWLLVCSALMAACPIMSLSRGGALITLAIMASAVVLLVGTQFLFPTRRQEKGHASVTGAAIALFCAATLVLGFALGWKALKPRMEQLSEGFEGREEMYAAARPMARDYPLFGVGPGAYETVFQTYRISTETYWPAQLHNDWLETRITFGWVGTILILLALLTVMLRWFAPGGIHGGRRFVILTWLAMGGCLAHARFDFPFQIYSILFLFLVLCAVLFNLARRA
jgi:O-antigen ligase